MNNITTCKRKVKYINSSDADKAVQAVRKKWGITNNNPCRKYRCKMCGNYHITTMSRHQVAIVKNRNFEKERLQQIADEWIHKNKW